MKIKRIKKQLDQEYILQSLQQSLDESVECSQFLNATLSGAMIDAYDQDISREAFANLVMAAFQVKSSHVAAATLRMMRDRYHAGALSAEMIDSSIAGNLDYSNHFRVELARQYALVKECRDEGETVS